MTTQADLAQANALSQELTNVSNAISIMENGGNLTTIVVTPRQQPAGPMGPQPQLMITSINITAETPPDVRQAIIRLLDDKYDSLSGQLEALGVTDIPPSRSSNKRKDNDG